MAVKPTYAKISPPAKNHAYARKRLFKLLNEASNKPICWISAPAGYGKTTLVASYLNKNKIKPLWYQLDEGDNDLASFFYYMGLAAKKMAPRYRKPLPLLTPEYLAGLTTFSRNFFRELFSRVKVPDIIVFDNYQDVPADSRLHQIIADALLELPPEINIIFMSRTKAPAPFSRLRASGLMFHIDWNMLRFSNVEAQDLAQHLGVNNHLNNNKILKMNELTQGWAAGLVLMLNKAEGLTIPDQISAHSQQELVFDYFASEVFQHLDVKLQSFLLKTALLPKFTASMANQLTGQHNAAQLLSKLTNEHYFTLQHAHPTASYEYHPLFSNFLLSLGKKRFAAQELTELQQHAAKILLQDEQLEDAVELYHQSEDWVSLSTLILHNAKLMLDQGRHATLKNWFDKIPQQICEQQSWLLFWLASSCLTQQPLQARHYYEQAFLGFQQTDDITGLYLTWSGVVDTFVYDANIFVGLDPWIDQFTRLYKKHPTFPSPEIECRATAAIIATFMYRQPQHAELAHWIERSWQLLQQASDYTLSSSLPFYFAHFLTLTGDMVRCTALMEILKLQIRHKQLTPLTKLTASIISEIWGFMTADWEGCDKSVETGIDIINQTGIHVSEPLLRAWSVHASLSQHDLDTAEVRLKEMEACIPPGQRLSSGHYYFLAGWSCLLQKNFSQARAHTELALQSARECGMPYIEAMSSLCMAQICFAQGQTESAADYLIQALNIGSAMHSNVLLFCGYCLRADFARANNIDEQVIANIKKAFAIGKQFNIVNHSLWQSDRVSRLCAIALQHNIETEYTSQLIRKRKLIPHDEAMHLDNWPWPIKIYTLGRFSLLKDDKPVNFTGKAQKRPLNLLKALLSFGGRDVNVSKLIDSLWPDTEADSAYCSFTMALKRLRSLLGYKQAIDLTDGHLSLAAHFCWIDAWVFEREVTRDIVEPVKTERTLSFYHGAFLNGDADASWALSMRQRLRRKFLTSITALGHYWEQQQEWKKAIDCYYRGLEIDDLAESFYQQIMLCYKKLGQKGEALQTYQECLNHLNTGLGVAPSEKTEALHQKLEINNSD